MTSAPFTTRTENYTFAELVADAALCRKVLADGTYNGWPLDGDSEDEWKSWLSDIEGEIEMRAEAEIETATERKAA